mgnify:CR=1 FL=1
MNLKNYLKPFVIAEIGCNHKGDIEIAKELIKVAKIFCNVDAVKFQKRKNKELLTEEQYNQPHPNPSNSYGETYGLHREYLEFDVEQHAELKRYCEEIGIIYSTSVWDLTSAKEIISLNVWVSIIIATIGIGIMAVGNTSETSLIGFVFGITSSVGFSIFSVSLRWRKETPKFTTTAFAGFFCFTFATIVILSNDYVFFSTSYNSSLFSLHGTLVCLGLILYSIGSKVIPAAELTLLSLTEVIGGIFWVWLPLFGINEVPDTNTIIGGFFLFISLTYYSLVMRWNKRYIGLN